MVLAGTPDPAAHDTLLRITGLPLERFESLYWADRHAYDEGTLTGLAFWKKFLHQAGLELPPSTAEELNLCDARMWTTEDPVLLAWQEQLKQHGLLTGILSNMGDNVLANIEREFAWIHRFDALVWSFQLHMAKPDPAIYRLCLDKLRVRPEEALFLDDKLANVEAAQALGMKALQFTTTERLREDLIAQGLDSELPLP
jgi:putative hydrolase of the HAD superfamily